MAEEEGRQDEAPDKATGEENGSAAAASGTESETETGAPARASRQPSRGGRRVARGIAHIRATFNNTVVSIADTAGGIVAWCSGGRAGFKGSRKSTAFAATVIGREAGRQAVAKGMQEVDVKVQGPGSGRESAIRALQAAGLTILTITDVTPIPHNGCRPRKRRRV